ncbi:hypothetical protein H8959_018042 [Pygathrix nigripes]
MQRRWVFVLLDVLCLLVGESPTGGEQGAVWACAGPNMYGRCEGHRTQIGLGSQLVSMATQHFWQNVLSSECCRRSDQLSASEGKPGLCSRHRGRWELTLDLRHV